MCVCRALKLVLKMPVYLQKMFTIYDLKTEVLVEDPTDEYISITNNVHECTATFLITQTIRHPINLTYN